MMIRSSDGFASLQSQTSRRPLCYCSRVHLYISFSHIWYSNRAGLLISVKFSYNRCRLLWPFPCDKKLILSLFRYSLIDFLLVQNLLPCENFQIFCPSPEIVIIYDICFTFLFVSKNHIMKFIVQMIKSHVSQIHCYRRLRFCQTDPSDSVWWFSPKIISK